MGIEALFSITILLICILGSYLLVDILAHKPTLMVEHRNDGQEIFIPTPKSAYKTILISVAALSLYLFVLKKILSTEIAPIIFALLVTAYSAASVSALVSIFLKPKIKTNAIRYALQGLAAICVTGAWISYPNSFTISLAAFALAIYFLLVLRIESVATIATMLIAFMIFDFLAVFVTNTMLPVAEKVVSLSLPLLIQMPRHIFSGDAGDTILGLGDIIIPGVFVSTILVEARIRNCPALKWAVLAGYSVGFYAAFLVVSIFHSGQPALIYLVPALLLSVFPIAWHKGFLSEWLFTKKESL